LIERFVHEGDYDLAMDIYDHCFNMPVQVGPKVKSTRMKNASGTGITTLLNTGTFSERELETTVLSLVFRSILEQDDPKDIAESLNAGKPPALIKHKDFVNHLRRIQNTWGLKDIFPVSDQVVHTAYAWIGPKFGDDGLDPGTPFVSDELWKCAMEYVDRMDGFERKLETSSAFNEEPVEYLSRIYPRPSSSLTSFCKVEKAVDKLSIALNRDRERYILKLRGYWTTDRNTPIVGAYIQAIANMYKVSLTEIGDGNPVISDDQINSLDPEDERRKIYEQDRELFYKIAGGPYPYDENDRELQYECVAADYGMTGNELFAFDKDLRTRSTWRDIQGMMLPKKMCKHCPEDPLGLAETPDPPGTERIAAFAGGNEPRMCDFESEEAKIAPNAAFDKERARAACMAFGRNPNLKVVLKED
jgi:hypothetical protein